MQQCSNCGHQNRAGVVFCENCGASLIGKVPLDTKSLEGSSAADKAQQIGIDASVLTDVKIQGISIFREGDMLQLEVEGGPEPIVFKPSAETIFGRRDPATGATPDVDLTPFAGYRMGVSRRHAAIRLGDNSTLDIWDLGSSNGTYLNGQRLGAHRPYRLHDGDELRLGQMMIRVFFQSGEKPVKAPKAAEAAQPQAEAKQAAVSEAKTDVSVTGAPKPTETKAEPAAPAPQPAPARPEAKEAPVASKPEAAAEQAVYPSPTRPGTQPIPPKEEIKETPAAPTPERSAAQQKAGEAPAEPTAEPAAPEQKAKETPVAPAEERPAAQQKAGEAPAVSGAEPAAPEQKAKETPAASADDSTQPLASPEQLQTTKAETEASVSSQAPSAEAEPPAATSETPVEKEPEPPKSGEKSDQESPPKPESPSE